MNPRIIRLSVGAATVYVSTLLFACVQMRCQASSEGADETAVRVNVLPEYSFSCDNGLYATISGFLKLNHVNVPRETLLHLNVNGFRQPMPVHAVLQDHEAPLVVVIPGINGKADSDFTKLWPSWYASAGFNVLYFDSTFRPELVSVIGKGVSGNVWSEAESVRDTISAYLDLETVRPRVTKIGVVGQSYGGLVALILGQMAKEDHVPFKIDAIQAYSPPIDLQKTADLFDRWYNEARWCYTLVQLASEVGKHKPSEGSCFVPFSNREMKAAIVAAFHLELIPVITANDDYYRLGQLPHGNQFEEQSLRLDYADTYGFTKYAYGIAYPYWRPILGPGRMEELFAATNLNEILTHQPSCSQTILSHDDPFNLPEDVSELESHAAQLPLTILPHGGHLGYVGEDWTRSKLLRIFDCATSR